jgi:tight adherence protein C
MTLLLSMVGVAGLALLIDGVLEPRRSRLPLRVEPYLSGLHGKPSGLLHTQRVRGLRLDRFELALRRFIPYRYEDVQERLRSAGDARRPEDFRIEQLLWGISATVVVGSLFSVIAVSSGGLDPRALPLLLLITFITGFLGRDWSLGRQVSKRRALISAELPVALDLIALAIMSGESVPAAFARVADRLGSGLGAELRSVVADIRAGELVVTAIEGLSHRLPDPAVARFVDALCTGIERGAPLSEVLRGQADDARDTRRRFLLELGGQREVLMLVPVVFLLMPVVVVFALFPGLVSLNLLVP